MRRNGNPRRFSARNLTCMWMTWKSVITLNGADVSAISDLLGNHNLAQGTAANQPLYTGAPSYVGHPSIQFTAANVDRLVKANVDIAGTGPVTVFIAANFAVLGVSIGDAVGVASGVVLRESVRTLQTFGGGARTFQWGTAITLGSMHVLAMGMDAGETAGIGFVDGVAQTINVGGAGAGAAPGATAVLSVGAIGDGTLPTSMDWMGAIWFQGLCLPSEALRVSKFLAAEVGVAA